MIEIRKLPLILCLTLPLALLHAAFGAGKYAFVLVKTRMQHFLHVALNVQKAEHFLSVNFEWNFNGL